MFLTPILKLLTQYILSCAFQLKAGFHSVSPLVFDTTCTVLLLLVGPSASFSAIITTLTLFWCHFFVISLSSAMLDLVYGSMYIWMYGLSVPLQWRVDNTPVSLMNGSLFKTIYSVKLLHQLNGLCLPGHPNNKHDEPSLPKCHSWTALLFRDKNYCINFITSVCQA